MTMHYTYRITWSIEDNAHVGLCAEFPSLSWLASTPAKALSGIQRLVRACIADMQTTGETPPVPLADRTYSGKFCGARAPRNAPCPRPTGSRGGGESEPASERAPRQPSGIARILLLSRLAPYR